MPRGVHNASTGPKTPEGKARALANLTKGNSKLSQHAGRENAEIRAILRQGARDSAPLLVKIAMGQCPYDHMDLTPSPTEMMTAMDKCLKYSLPELEPVLEETLVIALAEVLADDKRIPFECIGDITEALIQRLKPNAEARTSSKPGDEPGSGD